MKKKIKFVLLFFMAFTVLSFKMNVRALELPKLVITNPGEDASTQMNVNYHVSTEGTYVIYSEDQTFGGAVQIANPECKALPFSDKEQEFQCSAALTELKPNTRYYYYIAGTSMTDYKSFKTAGGAEFSFAHVTDIHSYKSGTANTRVTAANNVLNKINATKELDFVLASGDVTAYGTVYEQWETLYGMDVLKSNMFALTPGNHDYYNTSAAVVGVQYFNAVTNNPKNGAEGVLNSSYYFKYGNALFVSLNSEEAANNSTLRANQIKWLNEVTANNPADFIIAFTHRPFYTGDDRNATQASDMRSYFQEVFDNTGVDLVLSGHNHVYARTYQVFENKKVEGNALGTTYITGIQIGDRYQASAGTKPDLVEIAHLGAGQDGGSLITVSEDKISIEFIKADGTRLYPHEIQSKSNTINKSTIESSINAVKVNDKIDINFDMQNPGLIKRINVYNEDNELVTSKLNPDSEVLSINDAPQVARYNLKLEFLLRDNEIIQKDIEVYDEKYDFGTLSDFQVEEEELQSKLKWTATDLDIEKIVRYEIYVNGNKLKEVAYDQTSTVLDMVSPYVVNEISFRVIGYPNKVLFQHDFTYGEDTAPVYVVFNYETLKIKEGESKLVEYTVYPEQEVKIEFKSSNPNVATIDENGKITAVSEGTCIISLNVAKRWDVSSEFTLTVEDVPVEPDPLPEVKKGCFESGYIFTGLAVLGLTFILRRKKY